MKTPVNPWKRRIFYLFLATFLLTCAGTVRWVVNTIRNMDFGMMGGDCPEITSYSSVSLTGNVIDKRNNPHSVVQLVANKPKGSCPQSEEINNRELSVQVGNSFEASYGIHLGDKDVSLTITSDGYEICELHFSGDISKQEIDLQISLGSQLIVEQKTKEYRYILDKTGKWDLVTREPFGSPSYQQLCPKVS